MRGPWISLILGGALSFGMFACVGHIDGAIDDPNGDGTGGKDPQALGVTALRRLTVRELGRTASDLFGRDIDAAPLLPADPRVQGFERNSDALSTTAAHVDGFIGFAEQLAKDADLSALTGCTTIERSCVDALLTKFGRRAFRRPLTSDERATYLAMFDTLRAGYDAETATRALITRMLESPDFLYHVELGDDAGELKPYELAARLAYTITESMPDDALLDAAESGRLATDDDLEREANRLLATPRARDSFQRFFAQWLGVDALDQLDKDPALHPDFPTLRPLMRKEFETFVGNVVFDAKGGVPELFGASYTFANATLAPLYGASAGGDAFEKIALDPAQRAGVLTQSSVLAVHGKANRSSPILRGVFVLERLLCSPLPPPPPGASTIPKDAPPGHTTREFFATLTNREPCTSCHNRINSVGFGLEDFDEIGRFRTMENAYPIDASGSVSVGDATGTFVGGAALARKLASSTTVRRCAATQFFRWSYERIESGADDSVIDQVDTKLASDGLRALPLAIIRSPGFRRVHRTTGGAQ